MSVTEQCEWAYHLINLCWVELLNISKNTHVIFSYEINCHSLPAKSAWATDAMDVQLTRVWKIVVDDKGHLHTLLLSSMIPAHTSSGVTNAVWEPYNQEDNHCKSLSAKSGQIVEQVYDTAFQDQKLKTIVSWFGALNKMTEALGIWDYTWLGRMSLYRMNITPRNWQQERRIADTGCHDLRVLPLRFRVVSSTQASTRDEGGANWCRMTCCTSMPLAQTSVEMSTREVPDRNSFMMASLSFCGMSPCIALTVKLLSLILFVSQSHCKCKCQDSKSFGD